MQKLTKIKVEHVRHMPKVLEHGVLYVSREFGTAAHLCACGCGAKVRTPLAPTEWLLKEGRGGPSLWPSIGNWQKPCQSHYVIQNGKIRWAEKWDKNQIVAGRQIEDKRRKEYFEVPDGQHKKSIGNRLQRLKNLLFK